MDCANYYDDKFYATRERYRKVYRRFAQWIQHRYHPATVIELGSGAGYLLSGFDRRVRVLGVEGSPAAFAHIPPGIPTVHAELEEWIREPGRAIAWGQFDLAACVEVAEHLRAEFADGLVGLLTDLSDTVFFTAAPGGGPQIGHINPQPKDYWIARFADRGYRHGPEAVADFQAACRPAGCAWVVD
ncbi:MAG: class I SAM-dependent methyltransferase, partial [Phycisphaerae bacterium]|nr:class I SAM-dependent methyltransferase [Phycisphaerae bacterium]